MRGSTILLTSEAALVAAMVGRMGWVDWPAAIRAGLSAGLICGVVIVAVLTGAALFIGLPLLMLVGAGRAAVWLFRPVTSGDSA